MKTGTKRMQRSRARTLSAIKRRETYKPETVRKVRAAQEEVKRAKEMPFDPLDNDSFLDWLRERLGFEE